MREEMQVENEPIQDSEARAAHEEVARVAGLDDIVEVRAFQTREVLLYAAVAGPAEGEPVVLLHGFPDFWLGWRKQVRPLVEAGCRVIIPDLRGYHFSDKPTQVEAYRLPRLGGDVIDLIDAAGWQRVHLVGHDWGGGVSWWLGEHHPDRFASISILNCPHPSVLQRALKFGNARQMLMSWYIGLFQLPRLPEGLARAFGYRALTRALLSAENPNAYTEDEVALYRRAWEQPDALRCMMNWYRASGRVFIRDRRAPPLRKQVPSPVPTQVIWGERDKALHASLVEPSLARCKEGKVHRLPEASHWVQRDAPEQVNERLLEQIQGAR